MYTIIETPLFTADARSIWTDDERGEFCAWLSKHPLSGALLKAVRETIGDAR